jgi:hypothetical protein
MTWIDEFIYIAGIITLSVLLVAGAGTFIFLIKQTITAIRKGMRDV